MTATKTSRNMHIARPFEADTTTALTLALTNSDGIVSMDNASANVVTIPTNATVAFELGNQVDVIQMGVGVTSVTAAAGVTLNGVVAGTTAMTLQYGGATLVKHATDTWSVLGAIAVVA